LFSFVTCDKCIIPQPACPYNASRIAFGYLLYIVASY
jgi:hypothetical protein